MGRHATGLFRGVAAYAPSSPAGRWLADEPDGRVEERRMEPDGATFLGMFRFHPVRSVA